MAKRNKEATIQKLFEITKEWNELENSMGENAALEVACETNNTTSDWYYSQMSIHHAEVNNRLRELYEKSKTK